ncbi:MAG: FCD domain-containing protein [Candidatus Thiodiazotropha sp.]
MPPLSDTDQTLGNPPKTLTDQAYGKLRDDIIRGEFQPGSKLRIELLKQRYGMGATPLREALSRLTQNGFVTTEGQRGFRVSVTSLDDLEDITDMRVVLETLALKKSFEVGDDEWEARVIASFHQLSKIETATEPDLERWEERNRAYHLALISACHSKWLRRFYETLYDQHKRYRNLARIDRSVPRDVHAEHSAICDAALERNITKACQENENHIRRTAEVVAKMLKPKKIS